MILVGALDTSFDGYGRITAAGYAANGADTQSVLTRTAP
jgi:hypothetical protein